MSCSIDGKLFALTGQKSGQGANGNWVIQEFVVETDGQYPKKVAFEAWNAMANTVYQLAIGSPITVSFNPEANEYQGRWFTKLKAWKIEAQGSASSDNNASGQSPATAPTSGGAMADGDLPF